MDVTSTPPAAAADLQPTPAASFDQALERLRAGRVEEALGGLVAALAAERRKASVESWFRTLGEARAHPLREFIHRDPFALRCYAKPRGYPADATALDYVLRGRELPIRSNDPVGGLHHYTTHGQMARALLFRRDSIAREIDARAQRGTRPLRALAAGCGHLRECDRITQFATGRIERLVAFDMDAENLDGVRREYPQLPIVTRQGTVRQLVEGDLKFEDMDLVYTCGMLETLPQAPAAGLVRALFTMLAPGGTLVITHFLPGLEEAGFIEAFMDWRMVYRNQGEIYGLVKELPAATVSGWAYSESPESALGVVTVQRK